jgi:hypothetical protein
MIELKVRNKPGTVAAATQVLSEAGINIRSVFGWGPQGIVQLLVDDPRKAKKALTGAGIKFSEIKAEIVEISNEPGSLHTYLQKLAKKGVNLRSLSGLSSRQSEKSTVVWTAA